MQILSIGEILWDVMDQQEHLGGAPLNFCVALHRLGYSAVLLSGVGEDHRGEKALGALHQLGLTTEFIQRLPKKSTGFARVQRDSAGNANFVIPRPAAFDEYQLSEEQIAEIAHRQPSWVYFGTLAQTHPPALASLEVILLRLPTTRRFYDMNLRNGHWNLALVQHLSTLATVLKLNEDEAVTLFELVCPGQSFTLDAFCRYWSKRYAIETICVTLGGSGCAVFRTNNLQFIPGFEVQVVDTVGAGDAFAAGFLHGSMQGWSLVDQAKFANALGALVASRTGAIPAWTPEECDSILHTQRV